MTTSAPRPDVRSRTQAARAAGSRVSADVQRVLGAEPARGVEPGLRRPDDEDAERARELREDRGVQADRARALDDDDVAHRDPRALDGVKAGGQAAAAAQEIFRREPSGSGTSRTPGRISIRSDQPPSSPSAAGAVIP